MGSSLVIVESPAKAKTINKILGREFSVKASVGHIKDLPGKKLGVDVENNFEPDYGTIPGKEKVIKELKQAAKSADKIYLAPDPDREGEAIAFHIASEISTGKNDDRIFRVTFNEITANAVREAMKHPGKLNMDKVDAQQARRVLDRLVGYNLSPLLWKKVRRGLSAGRVQSVAVRLVVEREREILAFNKEEYWQIGAKFKGGVPPEFEAKLFRLGGELIIKRDAEAGSRFLLKNSDEAQKAVELLKSGKFVLSKVDKKARKRNPSPPFITSTLQQEGARKLGFSSKKTMMLAQQLYEGIELGGEGSVGLITYMRTDSVRIASDAQTWAREYIKKKHGANHLPEKPPFYKSKESAQEAHEAVRPTSGDHSPESIKQYLQRDQFKLYTLIWNRFISSQMKPAEFEQTTFDITCGSKPEALLRATGNIVTFPGFTAVYTETEEDQADDEECCKLPDLKEGSALELMAAEPAQSFTQPPPRYTEASLVKTLEEKGIGRPSTYAAIMSTIVDRKYVQKEQGRFSPTELGMVVNDYLVVKFPELLDIGFTAKMENKLDQIEEGKSKWVKVVKEFYKPFNKDLTAASEAKDSAKPKDVETGEKCEKCGSPMVIRWGRHGRFMACSGYPKCKNTRPLENEGAAEGGMKPAEPVVTNEMCPKCGSPMVIKTGKFGKFLACSKYPECKTTKPIPTGVKCPEDGGDIIERRTRGGRSFWSCSNYPNCKFAMWQRPIPEKCPNCGAGFLVIKKERGGAVFKACITKDCGYKAEISTDSGGGE